MKWLSQRSFNAPLICGYSACECLPPNANEFSPLRYGQRFIVKCYEFVSTVIVGLLDTSSPVTITSRVSNVIVGAFNTVQSCRPVAHVGVKGIERIAPFIAYCDGSSTVILKSRVVWVLASLNNSMPSPVLYGKSLAMICSSYIAFDNGLLNQAPARLCFAVGEPVSSDIRYSTAGTSAIPHDLSPSIGGAANDGEEVKYLTSKVFEFCHAILRRNIRKMSVATEYGVQLSGITLATT